MQLHLCCQFRIPLLWFLTAPVVVLDYPVLLCVDAQACVVTADIHREGIFTHIIAFRNTITNRFAAALFSLPTDLFIVVKKNSSILLLDSVYVLAKILKGSNTLGVLEFTDRLL